MVNLEHLDIDGMVRTKNPQVLFDYINEEILPNRNGRILPSHLIETMNLRSSRQTTYLGIFLPVESLINLEPPKIFSLLQDGTILHNTYDVMQVNHVYYFDPKDKGTQFNFNFIYPELGINLEEINKLLLFLKEVDANIFCTYETK